MAHPAKEARDRAQQSWPGATVVARLRNSIKHQHPTIPGKFMLDLGIGPMHYGPAEDQEINTAWQPGVAPWNFQMVQAGYNAFALANFSSGQIVKYVHPGTGESVAFQPQQLQYTNDLDQIQAIANPQSVSAVVQNEDVLFWQGAFGPGMDIRWQTQTARLDKRLVVDQASRWPAPTAQIIAGGNPVARLQFIFQVSNNLDIFVNGVLWNRAVNNPVNTQGYIEFRHSTTGEVLWTFNLPRSNGAPVEDQDPDELLGTFRLRRTGPNLFVEHRIPIGWLQTADYPIEIDTTIDEQVGAGSDDAAQASNDNVVINGNNENIDSTTEHAGLRWTTVPVPVGANIDTAWMSIFINTNIADEPQHQLRGELSGNPGTFTTGSNDIDARSRTTASVQWNSTNLGAEADTEWRWGAPNGSPTSGANIGAVIQEIVDQGTWAENNALVLIFEQHTLDAARDLQLQFYEWDTTHAAKLHIEYSSGPSGAGAATLAAVTAAGTALVAIDGDGAATLAAVTLASTAQIPVDADGAATLAAATLASTAQVAVDADGAATLSDATLASTSQVGVDGDGAATLADLTLSATASVTFAPVTGDGAATLADVSLAATSQVAVDGDGAATLADVTLVSTAQVPVDGDGAATLGDVTAAATAQVAVDGDGAATLAAVTLGATATVASAGAVTGDGAATLAAVTASGTAEVAVDGDGAATLADATLSATAQVPVDADGAATLADATLASTALVSVAGAGAATLGAVTAAGSAQVAVDGDGAATLAAVTLAATGVVGAIAQGNLAVTLADVTLSATALVTGEVGGGYVLMGPKIKEDEFEEFAELHLLEVL